MIINNFKHFFTKNSKLLTTNCWNRILFNYCQSEREITNFQTENLQFKCHRLVPPNVFNGSKRLKYTREKKSKTKDLESDDESDQDDEPLEKNAKMITSYLSIPRVDAVVKAGLGIARNKAEGLFFENKIRINGFKVPKKSHRIHIGDEVDVIRSPPNDKNQLNVSRIILISAKEVEDREELQCRFKLFKNLEIDNYEDHPYKSQTAEKQD